MDDVGADIVAPHHATSAGCALSLIAKLDGIAAIESITHAVRGDDTHVTQIRWRVADVERFNAVRDAVTIMSLAYLAVPVLDPSDAPSV